ncbi:MAG: protein kinase [Nannocystaceae bacterium]
MAGRRSSSLTRLRTNRVITSPMTGVRYKVGGILGEGGFGRAYRAQQLTRYGRTTDDVCIKTTTDQASWHREAYFGELFHNSRRVIRLFDSFPLALKRTTAGSGMLYCLVFELAEGGTIADYLAKTDKPWTEARAKREIIALLKLLDHLHGGGATHRDITPMNIFVTGRGTLKLGDFGIARHEIAGNRVTVEAFNPAFVTRGHLAEVHRQWLAVDDVFQMGQLLAMLLRGNATSKMTAAMVRRLDCDERLKEIIRRAIGRRSQRYANASEMLEALLGEDERPHGPVSSLSGKTVAFAGTMSIKRFDAEVMVLQAGGEVARTMSKRVDVLVQGARPRSKRAGYKGLKLKQAKRLIEQGHALEVIGEKEFRRLAGRKAS